MTALVFGGLSAYVLITRKDMSFLGGFITAGFFVLRQQKHREQIARVYRARRAAFVDDFIND